MFIYGGFSYNCETACDDLWRFEIPWAPMRYFPVPISVSMEWDRAATWAIKNDTVNSPGPRLLHKMVTDYEMIYIYLFGGVLVMPNTPN